MKQIRIYIFCSLVLLILNSCSKIQQTDFTERTKIALRDVGNKLLLSNQDSTSLILPVISLENNVYQLTFSNTLSFEPTTITKLTEESFKKAILPDNYRVEVLQCNDGEVAYSYQMTAKAESTIIPYAGRVLPEMCYRIRVRFTTMKAEKFSTSKILFYGIILLLFSGLGYLIFKKSTSIKIDNTSNKGSEKLGSFYFYPEQNKLIKEAQEIALSKKECELLALFVERPNEIIKRDELTKRVWEDNGVFVGRSLDTYISKLRKKLKSDASIKLTNIHGVGYKLEVE